MIRLLLLAFGLMIAAALPAQARPAHHSAHHLAHHPAARPVTILISIDGLRPDAISPALTPNLDAIARQAVSGTMFPSFPSVTFSNHWTLVTGLRPDRHGVVNGTMFDAAHPGVVFGKASEEPWWWDGGEPIWNVAERAGIHSGVMFWPGSTVAIGGQRPSNWLAYHAAFTNAQRAETVLDWMRRPAAIRPGLALIYFGDADIIGHRQGPYAPETLAAIHDIDAAIGHLRTGLRALGLAANLVIVSDHGMAQVDPAKVIQLKDYLPPEDYKLVSYGGILFINTVPGHEAALAADLSKLPDYIHCWTKGALPERFHYGNNPRVADWTCLPDPGARLMVGVQEHFNMGDHGYDPASPDMRALFLATGPAFTRRARLPVFDNVDIEPLLRDLIGLPPGKDRDGDDAPFKGVLRR